MLWIKPKGTSFYKRRLKSNLSFLRHSVIDQFIRLIEESTIGMKDCSSSINCSAVAAEMRVCRAIGLWWMFSWAQEEIWKISSNVPRPPGKVMKTSAWLNIGVNWSDIVKICSSSLIVFPMMCLLAKALGTTPKLDCLLIIQLLIHPPINPKLPPPYTKWIFLLANTRPRWFVDSKNTFSFPGFDPPKTQIF